MTQPADDPGEPAEDVGEPVDDIGKTATPRRGDPRPLLPARSPDDSELGWGEDTGGRDFEWYERERPPHWS